MINGLFEASCRMVASKEDLALFILHLKGLQVEKVSLLAYVYRSVHR